MSAEAGIQGGDAELPDMRQRLSRPAILLIALLVATLAPALPSGAAPLTEVYYVPTTAQGGALIRVEVMRNTDFDAQGQGVLLNYSPYNTIAGVPGGVNGTVVQGNSDITRHLGEGIAAAAADVLGTRGSTGCWDYGGLDEQQSGIDVVKFLAGELAGMDEDGNAVTLDWSNGRVGMTGVSYEGTTANMVAAAGDRVPELKAVVPIAAISQWYGYAFNNGMRYFLNSEAPTDEGFDTPLAFDFGFSDTLHTDNAVDGAIAHNDGDCGAAEHTMQAYSRNPDYTSFWQERDYSVPVAEQWTAATMVVHGWNDYNVKQDEAIDLYEHLATLDDPMTSEVEGPSDLRLWMTQSTHANGNGNGYAETLANFWRANLLQPGSTAQSDAAAFLDGADPVYSRPQRGGSAVADTDDVTDFAAYPPAVADAPVELFLNRTYEQDIPGLTVPGPGTGEVGELSLTNQFAGPTEGRNGAYGATSSWVDSALATEELSNRDPVSNDGAPSEGEIGGQGYYSLAFATPPVTRDVRLFGRAQLDGIFQTAAPVAGGAITPILVDITPSGAYRTIQRGFMNLDYRDGRDSSAGAMSGWEDVVIDLLPEDYIVAQGNRVGLILQSSNNVWAVSGNPMGLVTVGLGGPGQREGTEDGSVLRLPVVGSSEGLFAEG